MDLQDFGFLLIKDDIKRLKGIRSLENDLNAFFIKHKNTIKDFGKLSCEITQTPLYIICKERIPFTNPKTEPSKGGRLWFAIMKNNSKYIRCLLYMAKEESSYSKSYCFKEVYGRLKALEESL